MPFSFWFRRTSKAKATFRPEICLLEDRVVPVVLRRFPAVPAPPPRATQFSVIAPDHVESGKSFSVIIRAEDAARRVVPTFRGTTQITLTSADGGAVFPTSFTFSAADKGKHTIQMTLTAAGPQTVTATSGAITGKDTLAVDAPVTHFSVSAFGKTTMGTPTMVQVVALDANNKPVPGYTGTIHFTSTDLAVNLPANYTFTAADQGAHLFAVTFGSVGTKSLAVTATSNNAIAGGTQIKVCAPMYYLPWSNPYYNNWNLGWTWNGWGFPYGYGYGYG